MLFGLLTHHTPYYLLSRCPLQFGAPPGFVVPHCIVAAMEWEKVMRDYSMECFTRQAELQALTSTVPHDCEGCRSVGACAFASEPWPRNCGGWIHTGAEGRVLAA